MKNISAQQLATLKLLHIVVMTTARQCRSGFKHLQNNRRRQKTKVEKERRSHEQTGEETDGAERLIGFAWGKFVSSNFNLL